MRKAEKVRKVIIELPKYDIPELSGISEDDYELIRLAIINSIKGEIVAKEERTRQKFVERVYLKPAQEQGLLEYQDTSEMGKCDFEGNLRQGGPHFGLEVKGGEGNSVTLLNRPEKAEIFIVWSHLDVMSNTPAENMRAVLARIVKQMINRDERQQKVDFLVFYDEWYRSGVKVFRDGLALPDVFVLPAYIPTKNDRHPPLVKLQDNPFLKSLMKVVGNQTSINDPAVKRHIWHCDIELIEQRDHWFRRMKIFNDLDPNITFTEHEYTMASCRLA